MTCWYPLVGMTVVNFPYLFAGSCLISSVSALVSTARWFAENLAWFLLVVSDSFALKYEQVKFRE